MYYKKTAKKYLEFDNIIQYKIKIAETTVILLSYVKTFSYY